VLNIYRKYKAKRLIRKLHKNIKLQRKPIVLGGIVGGKSEVDTLETVMKLPDHEKMQKVELSGIHKRDPIVLKIKIKNKDGQYETL
jgi:hypothetical protein